jgi:hypothetical protein
MSDTAERFVTALSELHKNREVGPLAAALIAMR